MKKLSEETIKQIAMDLGCPENITDTYIGYPQLRLEIKRGRNEGKILMISPEGVYCFDNDEDCKNDENHIFECEFYRVI